MVSSKRLRERGEPVNGACYQAYFRSMALKLGFIRRKTPACLDCGGEPLTYVLTCSAEIREALKRTDWNKK
jgi:hypothetical protein